MRRTLTIVIALLAMFALMTSTVAARNAQILGQHTRVTTAADSFTVTGKAAGLAGGETYRVELSGTISGSAQCQNPGGNNPPPKGFTINVTASGLFTAAKNGNLNFTVTQPTGASSAADCPNPNWSYLVSYSGTIDIRLYDHTTGELLDTQTGVQVSFSNF
jgi:hypothetical protein